MDTGDGGAESGRGRVLVATGLFVLLVLAAVGGALWFRGDRVQKQDEEAGRSQAALEPAPPDLARLREPFAAGMAAMGKANHEEAIRNFSSFSFGRRAVEQYRLFYLASSLRQAGRKAESRRVLAALWNKQPDLIFASNAGSELGSIYHHNGDWKRSAVVLGDLAGRSQDPVVQSQARRQFLEAKFYEGDPAAMLTSARNLVAENPSSADVSFAATVLRAIAGRGDTEPLPLSPAERVVRIRSLLRDNNAGAVLDEIAVLERDGQDSGFRAELAVSRGLALARLRRFEESNQALESQLHGYYRWAIPAIYQQAKNYQLLAASINPIETKVVAAKAPKASARTSTRKAGTVKKPSGKTTVKKTTAARKAAGPKKPAAGKKAVTPKKSTPRKASPKKRTAWRSFEPSPLPSHEWKSESSGVVLAANHYRSSRLRFAPLVSDDPGEPWSDPWQPRRGNILLVAARKTPAQKKSPKTSVSKKAGGTKKNSLAKARPAGKMRRTATKQKPVPRAAPAAAAETVTNLALLYKKEAYERLWVERLKDLLLLPVSDPIRVEALTNLIALAETKRQDDYERELIERLAKIDPATEAGLQHFWDKGWAAYLRGDLATARTLFTFISRTYLSPNIRRQAEYWTARTLDRSGDKAAASGIYARLAAADYEDLYSVYSQRRGARPVISSVNPLKIESADWTEIAEKEMPRELRLGYELSALGNTRDAKLEIQKNMNPSNRKLASAVLAESFFQEESFDLAVRSLRVAYPEIATVAQNRVPRHFIARYYPLRYEDSIRKHAATQGLDPYLVMALIRQESSFNTRAKSPVGATGLMQLMPATGKELGTRIHGLFTNSRLENPDVNIELGTHYLKKLIVLLKGNEELAIAGYNGGPYRIKKWREQNQSKPIDEFLEGLALSETRNYVKRVTMLRSAYKKMHL